MNEYTATSSAAELDNPPPIGTSVVMAACIDDRSGCMYGMVWYGMEHCPYIEGRGSGELCDHTSHIIDPGRLRFLIAREGNGSGGVADMR